jgi:ribosomal protein S18 acetylase RimI-like enzyme
MAGVTVRASSPADAEAVEGLRIAGWKTAYQGIMPDDYLDGLPVDVGRRRRHLEDLPPGVTDEVAVAVGTATVGTATVGTATDGTATDGTAADGTGVDGTGAGGTGADGAIVGWVAYGTCRDPDRAGPRYGEIFACYVHPDWWRKGTGRLLMGHAIDGLVRSGRDDISLWVLEANDRARRFYEALGFAPDGTRKLVNFGVPVPEVRYRRPPAS